MKTEPTTPTPLICSPIEKQIKIGGMILKIIGEKWESGQEKPSKNQLIHLINLLECMRRKL